MDNEEATEIITSIRRQLESIIRCSQPARLPEEQNGQVVPLISEGLRDSDWRDQKQLDAVPSVRMVNQV